MPEINHRFHKGKMNQDLDERLLPDGQYREALNVEVSTSEESNVGTIQTVGQNVSVSSVLGTNVNSSLDDSFGTVVGSHVDESNNYVYYFVAGWVGEIELTNTYDGSLTPGPATSTYKFTKDAIYRYEPSTGLTIPVFIDIYEVETNIEVTYTPASGQFYGNLVGFYVGDGGSLDGINNNIREGMKISGTFNGAVYPIPSLFVGWPGGGGSPEVFNKVELFSNPMISGCSPIHIVQPMVNSLPYFPTGSLINDPVVFHGNRPLNFDSSKKITNINIIDDMMFWTDGYSDPKKINIKNCIEATPVSGDIHTKHYVYDVNGSLILGYENRWMGQKGKEINVIKRSPNRALNLVMSNTLKNEVDSSTHIAGSITTTYSDPLWSSKNNAIPPVWTNRPEGYTFNFKMPDTYGFEIGDVVLVADPTISGGPAIDDMFDEFALRLLVMEVETIGTDKHYLFKIATMQSEGLQTPPSGNPMTWPICLEQAKPLFEFKFVRFAYRWKFEDGQYSSISPFSEIAFIPRTYKYDSKEAYNLGMVNDLRSLKLINFITKDKPNDVISVDILYKESDSPNIYTVKTINYPDEEWEAHHKWGSHASGVLEVKSELIHAVVPANQLIRPWDNVPRTAKTQDIVGNRIVYANYLQNYNLTTGDGKEVKPDLTSYLESYIIYDEDGEAVAGAKPARSIKSLRNYQIGIVYRDYFGRETPVLSSKKSSFSIEKQMAGSHNTLSVKINNEAPTWADSFKLFIKETSNEYYNMAMDRWYNAEDGNVWISFPSADRSKVEEGMFIHLKKAHGNDTFISAEARYKVIAIDNDVPKYVKTDYFTWGKSNIGDGQASTVADYALNKNSDTIKIADWGTQSFSTSAKIGAPGIEDKKYTEVRIFNDTTSISTKWYKIAGVTPLISGASPGPSTPGTIKVKGKLGQEIEDLLGKPDATGVNEADYHVEIREAKEEHKAEFDGRFFVKIADDDVFNQYVKQATGEQDLLQVAFNYRLYHLYSPSNSTPAFSGYIHWWREAINRNRRNTLFIDAANRYWTSTSSGSTKGPYPNDYGHGLKGERAHIEMSVSSVMDISSGSFGMGNNSSGCKKIFDLLGKTGTWFRFDDDPDGCIYRISRTIKSGSDKYESLHGRGIFNYSASSANPNLTDNPSNKTRRIYMFLEFTGWAYKNLNGTRPAMEGTPDTWGEPEYEYDNDLAGYPPAWVNPTFFSPWGGTNHLEPHFIYRPGGGGATSTTPPPSSTLMVNGVYVDTAGTTIYNAGAAPIRSQLSTIGPAGFSETDLEALTPGSFREAVYLRTDGNEAGTAQFSNIQIMKKYEIGELQEKVEKPAVFETEPKEDIGLDIYYEMSGSTPINIDNVNGVLLAEKGSTVTVEHADTKVGGHTLNTLANLPDSGLFSPTFNYGLPLVGPVGLTLPNSWGIMVDYEAEGTQNGIIGLTESQDRAILVTKTRPYWYIDPPSWPAGTFDSYMKGHMQEMVAYTDAAGVVQPPSADYANRISFTRYTENLDAFATAIFGGVVTNTTDPGSFYNSKIEVGMSVTGPGLPDRYPYAKVIDYNPIWDKNLQNYLFLDTACFPTHVGTGNDKYHFFSTRDPKVVRWWDNRVELDCKAWDCFIPDYESGKPIITFNKLDGSKVTAEVFQPAIHDNYDFTSSQGNLVLYITQRNSKPTIATNWFNCYAFGNGVESDRIRDDFNALKIDKGVKASTVLAEKYAEEQKKNGLIYSGIYNSTSGVNNLNQFIQGEKITKDISPRFGSIQKIFSRDGDLITLCEDKCMYILADKDALYNADGTTNLISSSNVLGQTKLYKGEHGISTDPESFVSASYRSYFTDKTRGKVMRLSADGLTPISAHGMTDYFSDKLKNANFILGTYDAKKETYNLTVDDITASFSEKVEGSGWTSFKSFIPESGVSLNNSYYTFKLGQAWEHHDTGGAMKFYGTNYDAYVDVILNENPNTVKSFIGLKYDGTQAKITQNIDTTYLDGEYYNNKDKHGWFVETGYTNLESLAATRWSGLEFKDKEEKWFSKIKGANETLVTSSLATSKRFKQFSYQGIDISNLINNGGGYQTKFILTVQDLGDAP